MIIEHYDQLIEDHSRLLLENARVERQLAAAMRQHTALETAIDEMRAEIEHLRDANAGITAELAAAHERLRWHCRGGKCGTLP